MPLIPDCMWEIRCRLRVLRQSEGLLHIAADPFIHPVHFYSFCPALSLQIIWVMVPMGQKLHQVRGLYRVFTARPMMVEVSMML